MANYIGNNSVSRNLPVEGRSWETVVHQAGLPVLDSEMNLAQNLRAEPSRHRLPSGVLSHTGNRETGFVFDATPNTLTMQSFLANIAGREVYVGGTNSADPLLNLVQLPAPSATTGLPPDIKRTDFVFLEVWKALVTPTGLRRVTLLIEGNISGDAITIDETALGGGVLTITEGVDFNDGVDLSETARNIATAINALAPTVITVNAFTRGYNAVFLEIDNDTPVNPSAVISSTTNAAVVREESAGSAGENKPNNAKVWFEGNTQSDSSLWLDDDLVDGDIGYATSRRVQTQYRFRVVSTVDPKTQYYGFEDQSIVAQGTQGAPVAGYYFSRADGVEVVRGNGTNSYPHKDNGLFYSGDGSAQSAAALGAVDGYVYAIPVCYVFRRNQGAFDPVNTANTGPLSTHAGYNNGALIGGVQVAIGAGVSDRPDGLFSDIISQADVLDLRRRVYPFGVDYHAELKYQFSRLLDNRLRTWQMDGSDLEAIGTGSGGQSPTPLVCDEFGRDNTPDRGNYIRPLDHVCRRFSSSPVIQRLTLKLSSTLGTDEPSYPPYNGGVTYDHPVDATVLEGDANWVEGTQITIDLTSLDTSTDRGWTLSSANPAIPLTDVLLSGAKIIAVEGGRYSVQRLFDVLWQSYNPNTDIDLSILFSRVEGLGTNSVTITLDSNYTELVANPPANPIVLSGDVSGANYVTEASEIYFDLIVEYPAATGLSRIVGEALDADDSVYEDGEPVLITDSTQYPPFVEGTLVKAGFTRGSREVTLEYVAGVEGGVNDPNGGFGSEGYTNYYAYLSDDLESVTVPYKVYSEGAGSVYEPTLNENTNNTNLTIDYTRTVFGEEHTRIYFNPALPSRLPLSINFYQLDPLPNYGGVGLQVGVYYRTVAPQTCGSKSGLTGAPQALSLDVLSTEDSLSVVQSGASSAARGYPYASASEQLGVNPAIVSFTGEEDMLSSLNVSVEGFSINTGFLQLPALVPMDGSQSLVVGNSQVNKVTQDVEGRTVYTDLQAGSEGYVVSVFSQPLTSLAAHKTAYPILAKVKEGTPLFRKGEVVLVVLSRLSDLEGDNKVILSSLSSDTRTVACVYRVENLMLLGD